MLSLGAGEKSIWQCCLGHQAPQCPEQGIAGSAMRRTCHQASFPLVWSRGPGPEMLEAEGRRPGDLLTSKDTGLAVAHATCTSLFQAWPSRTQLSCYSRPYLIPFVQPCVGSPFVSTLLKLLACPVQRSAPFHAPSHSFQKTLDSVQVTLASTQRVRRCELSQFWAPAAITT